MLYHNTPDGMRVTSPPTRSRCDGKLRRRSDVKKDRNSNTRNDTSNGHNNSNSHSSSSSSGSSSSSSGPKGDGKLRRGRPS